MKVRLTIPGAAVAVEMEDGQATRVFKELAGQLIGVDEPKKVQIKPRLKILCKGLDKATEAEKQEVQEAFESTIDTYLEAKEIANSDLPEEPTESAPADKPDKPIKDYKGFLYIKCESCGNVRGFCAKEPISAHRCKCGNETELKELVPLWVHCECGKRFKYMTNIDEFLFDINCIDCGTPVSVKWNANKRLYETIR